MTPVKSQESSLGSTTEKNDPTPEKNSLKIPGLSKSQQKKAMKKAREKAKKEEDQKKKVQEEKDNNAKPGKLKLVKKNFVKEKTIEGLKTDVALAEIDFDFDDCESDGGIDGDDISKSNSKFFTKTPD